MSGEVIAFALLFTAAGAVAGWLYFSIMHYSMTFIDGGTAGIVKFVALALARMALFAVVLIAAFAQGLWSVIGYAAGFLVMRTAVLARVRKFAEPAPHVENKSQDPSKDP